MALTHNTQGSVIFENGKSGTAVAALRADGTEGLAATGYATTASQTPTITAGAYTALDAVGGLLTFANVARVSGGTVMIHSVAIADLAKQSAALTLVLFDRTFTATTDNDPFDPADADLANCVGVIPITPGDYQVFNDNAAATLRGVALVATLNGTSLFGQLMLPSGSAPTYASTSDLTVKIGTVQLT